MVELACGLLVVMLVTVAALYDKAQQQPQVQRQEDNDERPPLYW